MRNAKKYHVILTDEEVSRLKKFAKDQLAVDLHEVRKLVTA